MDMKEKTLENLARRMAKRQGLQLVKTRRRDKFASDYGTYRLVEGGVALMHTNSLGAVMHVLTRSEWGEQK